MPKEGRNKIPPTVKRSTKFTVAIQLTKPFTGAQNRSREHFQVRHRVLYPSSFAAGILEPAVPVQSTYNLYRGRTMQAGNNGNAWSDSCVYHR